MQNKFDFENLSQLDIEFLIDDKLKKEEEKVIKVWESENIKIEANKSLEASLKNIKVNNIIKTTFFGLSLGSVLLLAAIGLAITFGVVGVINMAHGELIMLGAYCAYVVQQIIPNNISASIIISLPVAFVLSLIHI